MSSLVVSKSSSPSLSSPKKALKKPLLSFAGSQTKPSVHASLLASPFEHFCLLLELFVIIAINVAPLQFYWLLWFGFPKAGLRPPLCKGFISVGLSLSFQSFCLWYLVALLFPLLSPWPTLWLTFAYRDTPWPCSLWGILLPLLEAIYLVLQFIDVAIDFSCQMPILSIRTLVAT